MDKIKKIIDSDAYSSLLNENISSLQSILWIDNKAIQNITGVPPKVIDQMKYVASEELLKGKFKRASDIEHQERIKTGCQNIDKILSGGIPINGIIEIYGCSGVGKTQLCLQVALHIQLEKKGKEVIYISTEDVFPSKRLNQLADAYRKKYNAENKFEDHIYLEHIADPVQLQKCLNNYLPHFMSTHNVGLIIIDSIAGIFRSENENPNYVSRSSDFNVIAKALNKLQDNFKCGIMIVNQVTDNVSSGTCEPCLGLSWANNVVSRLCLTRNSASATRRFQVVFSPDLPPNTTNIIITSEGLVDQ